MKTMLITLTALVIIITAGLLASPRGDASVVERRVYVACATDEGEVGAQPVVPCVWDARHQGNGKGQSFKLTRQGKVVKITHHRAKRLLGHNHKELR